MTYDPLNVLRSDFPAPTWQNRYATFPIEVGDYVVVSHPQNIFYSGRVIRSFKFRDPTPKNRLGKVRLAFPVGYKAPIDPRWTIRGTEAEHDVTVWEKEKIYCLEREPLADDLERWLGDFNPRKKPFSEFGPRKVFP